MAEPSRQGDVYLHPVKSIPKDAVALAPEAEGVVLAYGEQTGHHHRIADTDAAQLFSRVVGKMEERYLKVTAPVPFVHEEHNAAGDRHHIHPGNYQVLTKREYVAKNGERPVYD